MSSNSTTNLDNTSSHIIYILDRVKHEFLVYLPLIFIIFGVIGFVGNAFTFLQPILRYNTCCIYLLCGSFVDVINLFINLLSNYTNVTADNILSSVAVRYLCKLKLFDLVFLPQLSANLLILSLIDRYACTCSLTSSIRHIRRLKIMPWSIIATILISGIISLYSPMFYDVVLDMGCTCINPLLNGVFYILIHGLITPLVMLIFVLLTYQNVKKSRHRAGINNLANIDRSRNPFIRMVFTQVLITSFLTLQWICFYIYHLITVYNLKTNEERVVHYFIWYVSNNIYYLINVKSFYLSTLTSRLFRKTFLKSLLGLLPYYQQRRKNKKLSQSFVDIPSRNKSETKSQCDF